FVSLPRSLPPTASLFPYTTLFRSFFRRDLLRGAVDVLDHGCGDRVVRVPDIQPEIHARGNDIGAAGNGVQPSDGGAGVVLGAGKDRKSTRLNSSHVSISYAVFCLK